MTMANTNQDLLFQPEVSAWTRLAKSSVYSLSERGLFPKPLRLSPHRLAWLRADVEKWLNDRISEKN